MSGTNSGVPSLLNSGAGGLASSLSQTNTGGLSGGNRTYYNGLPLILRGPKYATAITKTNRTIQAMPRQKFLFYAKFTPGPNSLISNKDFSSLNSGFSFQISKIDRPKVTPEVKELHQYNRKRLIHTGIKFDQMTVTFHDTVDDRILKVWRDYYVWYFGEGRQKNIEWQSSVVEKDFSLGTGWGFSPANIGNNTNFFSTLEIYTFYGKKFTKATIHNPKIVSIDFDQMDTESAALAIATMSIQHEGVDYSVCSSITSKEVAMFNLNAGDYYEPTDLFGGVNTFLLDLNDSMVSAVDGLLNNVSGIPFVGQVLSSAGSQLFSASGVGGFVPKIAQKLSTGNLARWGKFF